MVQSSKRGVKRSRNASLGEQLVKIPSLLGGKLNVEESGSMKDPFFESSKTQSVSAQAIIYFW